MTKTNITKPNLCLNTHLFHCDNTHVSTGYILNLSEKYADE